MPSNGPGKDDATGDGGALPSIGPQNKQPVRGPVEVTLDRSGGRSLGMILDSAAQSEGGKMEGGMKISEITEGGQAEGFRELRAGQVITHVNGTDISGKTHSEALGLITSQDTATLTVVPPAKIKKADVRNLSMKCIGAWANPASADANEREYAAGAKKCAGILIVFAEVRPCVPCHPVSHNYRGPCR